MPLGRLRLLDDVRMLFELCRKGLENCIEVIGKFNGTLQRHLFGVGLRLLASGCDLLS